MRRIVCAALRLRNSEEVICSARHFDPLMRSQIAAREGIETWKSAEQGFVDQFGIFVNREDAHCIAKEAGQILRRCGEDTETLFSENLY